MNPFKRTATMPLGVDLGDGAVAIVAAGRPRANARALAVREAASCAVARGEPDASDLGIATALGDVLGRLRTRERRCIVAVPPHDVAHRTFRAPPGMRAAEARRAAELEADAFAEWPAPDRLVAIDPFAGAAPGHSLISVARRAVVLRTLAIARAAGLRPVAVDVPACAWRRVTADADALLDCSRDRATLEIFGEPFGTTTAFPPRLIDERLAGSVRSALVEARRDGIADVQRVSVLAAPMRYEILEALMQGDGYAIAPLRIGDAVSPPWAFAFALASWSVTQALGVA